MAKDYFKKGMKDGASGDFDPPHGGFVGMFFSDSEAKDRRAYTEGYYYTKGQSDGAVNNYSPPASVLDTPNGDYLRSYRKGWDNGFESRR